ncbi:DUF3617 domain-containing protein [Proteobacteria bacterium 005FR1]|nr:DUF3617 domain-containing protein [Proteobacteria bacterium 005FR1]
MKAATFLVSAAVLLGAVSNVHAQPELEPGLWKYSFDIESQSGQIEAAMEQMKKMLESLPAEQRQMVEQQMASRGIGLDLESYTAQTCITPEQAKAGELPQPSDDCTQEVLEQSKDGYKVRFTCEGTTGEGEIRLLSDKAYEGKVTINTTMNGQSEQIIASQSGTWVSADCGSVKPMSP